MGWFYTTAGCTLFPDKGIGDCCKEHDEYYRTQPGTRLKGDRALLECGIRNGHRTRATLAYAGIRLFGWIRWYWIKWTKPASPAA